MKLPRHIIALAVGAVAISFAAIFFRLAAPTDPILAPAIRLLIAATLLSPWIFWQWRSGKIDRSVGKTAMLGGVLYAFHFGLWVTSLFYTSVAASVTLVTATPVMLAVYGLLTGKDAPTRRLWTAILFSTIGVAIIAGGDFSTDLRALFGDALALGGAAAIAVYFVKTRELENVDVFVLTGISSFFGGLLLLGFAWVKGASFEVEPHAWLYLGLAALIPQLIGHSCLFWALRKATPTQVGLATLAEPIFAATIAWLWLAEIPTTLTFVGSGLVLVGVFIAVSDSRS